MGLSAPLPLPNTKESLLIGRRNKETLAKMSAPMTYWREVILVFSEVAITVCGKDCKRKPLQSFNSFLVADRDSQAYENNQSSFSKRFGQT